MRKLLPGWMRLPEGYPPGWACSIPGGPVLCAEKVGGDGALIEWEATVDGKFAGRGHSHLGAQMLAEDAASGVVR